MCPVFGDIDPALRGQPRDTEGCKKGMQQGGVVSVPHILEIKLPVVVQNLRGGAEDLWLAMQDPVNARADLVSDVIRQWRRLGAAFEYEVTELVDAQFLEAVLFEAETRRHAALAGDAAAKGDAIEVAFEIVTPGMVDAGQVVGMAASLQADEVAAMSAAVNHRVDLAVVPAGDDDRRLPIAWISPSCPRVTMTGVSPRNVVR